MATMQAGPRPACLGALVRPRFALLAPGVTSSLATRFSGRALLTAGLAISAVDNLIFWAVARAPRSYSSFVAGMLVSGCGAGLLNGRTVKVLSGSVPRDRAGMASGLASTTRLIGILVSVAGMGAVLTNVMRRMFGNAARAAGPAPSDVAVGKACRGGRSVWDAWTGGPRRPWGAARGRFDRVRGWLRSGEPAGRLRRRARLSANRLVRSFRRHGTPSAATGHRPCKFVDCRDPL